MPRMQASIRASRIRVAMLWALTSGLLAVSGCGQKPSSVQLKPSKITIYGFGRSASLAADVLDAKGQVISGLPINWTSSDPKVATVEFGTVKSVGAGKAVITAQHEAISATANVDVVDIAAVMIQPPRTTLAGKAGDTISFTAEIRDSKDQPVNLEPKWEVTDAKVAKIDEKGTVTALSEGRVSVTASLGEIGGSGDLRVLFREIDTFQVTPVTMILPVGGTQNLSIVAKSPEGVAIDDVAVTYTSSDPKTAVASNGLVRAISVGAATIKIACGPKTAAISVVVLDKDSIAAQDRP